MTLPVKRAIKAFSLVETIIALFILSLVSLALLRLGLKSRDVSEVSVDERARTELLKEKYYDIRNRPGYYISKSPTTMTWTLRDITLNLIIKQESPLLYRFDFSFPENGLKTSAMGKTKNITYYQAVLE